MRKLYQDDWNERVIYIPPKSSAFGHQAKRRDARLAWEATTHFLSDCALFRLGPGITLNCYELTGGKDPNAAHGRQAEARHIFGPEDANRSSTHVRHWPLAAHQLTAGIEFALDDDQWPKQELGPAWLAFSYAFVWRDLLDLPHPSADEFASPPWGEDWSTLGIILGGGRLFLQPMLILPFPYDSDKLVRFLERVEPLLPFRLRDQYFKRALRSRTPGYGRVRKLEKNWRSTSARARTTPESE